MLEKPDLPDESLIRCLRTDYGMEILSVEFMPLGADTGTAVYRVGASDGTAHFVKLRRGQFDPVTVLVPRILSDRGIEEVINPIETRDGRLWTTLAGFTLILYPFVDGENGFERALTGENWITLGGAMRRIHSTVLPETVNNRIPRETYSGPWRERARTYLDRAKQERFGDPVARAMAELLRDKRETIIDLIERAERLARTMPGRPLDFVPCHADIHGGNVLIDGDGQLYIVDWDTLLMAPKERDLMYIGAGIGRGWDGGSDEQLFYQGYGPVDVDLEAIAYYRCDRIVEDIAEFAEQVFLSGEGREDREQAVRYAASNFQPNGIVDRALDACRKAGI